MSARWMSCPDVRSVANERATACGRPEPHATVRFWASNDDRPLFGSLLRRPVARSRPRAVCRLNQMLAAKPTLTALRQSVLKRAESTSKALMSARGSPHWRAVFRPRPR